MKLSIGIIGTRGIPNHYGGFEQAAEYISIGLAEKGHAVSVYNSHKHPFREKNFRSVQIIHCYDPEYYLGTAGQFIYDLNCIINARRRKFDVLLFMGYTSSSIWSSLFPMGTVIISNMDGLEWKRQKYPRPIKRFLRYAEQLAVNHSDYCIADSPVIKDYLDTKYRINSRYIPYGAEIDEHTLAENCREEKYFLMMARMEPENNIETILDGYHESKTKEPFIVIGNTDNKFGKRIKERYRHDSRIMFKGSLFSKQSVADLISKSSLYFHGHSVGGTNPSLLQAMAGGALIAAHDNPFNRSVLEKNAFYFSSAEQVKDLVSCKPDENATTNMIKNNLRSIRNTFNWSSVIEQYESYILECYHAKENEKVIYS